MSTTDIMDTPAITPPPGVVPNFDDPPNGNTMALAVMSVCLAVTTIAMVLRFYSRWAVVQMVQWQDYLLLVAFGIYIAMLALTYRLSSEVGWFVHRWDLQTRDVVEFLHVSQPNHHDSNLSSLSIPILSYCARYRRSSSARIFSWASWCF